MTRDALLEHVPPIACYRRRPLADRRNALGYWQQAAESLVPPEDEELCEKLASVDAGSGRLTAFPAPNQHPLNAISHLSAEQGWELAELHLESGRLDEVFRKVTGGASA